MECSGHKQTIRVIDFERWLLTIFFTEMSRSEGVCCMPLGYGGLSCRHQAAGFSSTHKLPPGLVAMCLPGSIYLADTWPRGKPLLEKSTTRDVFYQRKEKVKRQNLDPTVQQLDSVHFCKPTTWALVVSDLLHPHMINPKSWLLQEMSTLIIANIFHTWFLFPIFPHMLVEHGVHQYSVFYIVLFYKKQPSKPWSCDYVLLFMLLITLSLSCFNKQNMTLTKKTYKKQWLLKKMNNNW